MSSRTILLVRHGRSAAPFPSGFIDASGVDRWRAARDVAGITPTTQPPSEIVERVARASLVLSSDLPRAVESAQRLAPGRAIEITPLLRECVSIVPRWLPGRWPLRGWLVATGIEWTVRVLRGTEASPEDRARVAKASRWLTELASEHESIVVVGHGMFRRLLAAQLARDGWSAVPGRRSYRLWSAWEMRRGAGDAR